MKPADRTEYIVLALREGARMYEEDARAFLAEHDAEVRAEADGFRDDVIREAIACLSGLADSVSEQQQPGLDFAVGVLLDMVTGGNETNGGAS